MEQSTQFTLSNYRQCLAFFQKTYPGLYEKIRTSSHNFTDYQVRILIYCYIGIDNSDISRFEGNTNGAVAKAKKRLKAQLEVDNLFSFVNSLRKN